MTSDDSLAGGSVALEAESLARVAQLRYVNDDEPGYVRKRWGRGFTYYDPQGNRVTDPDLRWRFESLAIPPAWEEVWICPSIDGHIQATGRDEKRRKQYIYHERWEETADEVKFDRLAAFGRQLPELRAQIDEDLRGRKLLRDRVVALVLCLLDESLIRVCNHQYAVENGSYGLTTLLKQHVRVSGSKTTFSFPGKGGKHNEVVVKNHRLAHLIDRCQALPSQILFQYLDEEGDYHPITSTEVNDYLQKVTGDAFTAKEFRTWGATVSAAAELAALGPAASDSARQDNLKKAIEVTADALGNTPAVCRQYYIHPHVLEAYESGALASMVGEVQSGKLKPKEGLAEIEAVVLALLGES